MSHAFSHGYKLQAGGPAAARDGRHRIKNMSWTELGAGVFVKRHVAGDINLAAIVGPQGVAMVDTRGSGAEAQEIVDDVEQRFNLPIVAAIKTHAHYDHSFGNSTLPASAFRSLDTTGFPPNTPLSRRRAWQRGGRTRRANPTNTGTMSCWFRPPPPSTGPRRLPAVAVTSFASRFPLATPTRTLPS